MFHENSFFIQQFKIDIVNYVLFQELAELKFCGIKIDKKTEFKTFHNRFLSLNKYNRNEFSKDIYLKNIYVNLYTIKYKNTKSKMIHKEKYDANYCILKNKTKICTNNIHYDYPVSFKIKNNFEIKSGYFIRIQHEINEKKRKKSTNDEKNSDINNNKKIKVEDKKSDIIVDFNELKEFYNLRFKVIEMEINDFREENNTLKKRVKQLEQLLK